MNPPGGNVVLQWNQNHTFWIHHPNGYSSFFLHASDFEQVLRSELVNNGFAYVTKGQVIAYVGGYGGVPPHLHYGIRYGDTLCDPYGSGEQDNGLVLWQATPPNP